MEQALARPGTPRESHLIGLLIGELDQLPEKDQRTARQTQREYDTL
ncbi:hypothetical protein [Streptomyces beijiangensis]|uniref:Uncharacterized protein n=1 Tax=Streptomyces beijiangensis TaxID=163361 RepID=A0A939F2T4_9ACTN|nr:hypothetical protein [Streptomyces beijiangensis]MBO0511195.1 hypothetical protein [Streptomyces beijiangensis]